MDKFTIPNSRRATEKVKRYTIMFENIPILEFNIETDEVTVYEKAHLPFGLRGKEKISSAYVLDWLNNRINNLNRPYMNMVYIARKVGRDRDKVIKDSSGISFTDNFWIRTHDSIADWDELKKLRDDLNSVMQEYKEKGKNIAAGHTQNFIKKLEAIIKTESEDTTVEQ